MKKIRIFGFIFVSSMLFCSASSWASSRFVEQYTNYSLDRPWLGIGVSYSLFSQTNNTFPTLGNSNTRKTFGNAFDITAEIFLTRFLSVYLGYQYMKYDWDKASSSDTLSSQKALQGLKLYVGGLFVSTGIYERWVSRDFEGKSSVKGQNVGPFVGFGYSMNILRDFLDIETGGRLYFVPDKYNHTSNLSLDYTANGSSKSDYFSWDWYIGLKFLL